MNQHIGRPGRPRRGLSAFTAAAALLACGTVAVLPAGSASAAPGLIGHWAFDEGKGTTTADSAGSGQMGTVGAGASWIAGRIGSGALSFNGGANATVDIPAPAVDTSKSFSVAAWVRLNDTNGFQTAVSIDGDHLSGFFLQLSGVTGKLAFTRRAADDVNSAEVRADSTVKPAVGSWYHVVGVQDAEAKTLKVYVDGVSGSKGSFGSPWKAKGHTVIGRGKWADNPADSFHGSVDDVRFYQGALTGQDVAAFDQNRHWTFDEGSGGTAADATGSGNTAVLGTGASWTAGRVGDHALEVDGTANGVATATGPAVGTDQSFSVSTWVKLDSTKGPRTFVSTSGTQVSGYSLGLGDNRTFAFSRPTSDASGAPSKSAEWSVKPKLDTWYHLTGVQDTAAGKLRLYVNGAQVSATDFTTPWKAAGDTLIGGGLAAGKPAHFADGAIDDVQTYNFALLPLQAQSLVGSALNVNAGQATHALPDSFFGVMTEDINHSMTGGLYPELINNRSFKADANKPVEWSAVGGSTIALDTTHPLNKALDRSLKLTVGNASEAAPSGVANGGYWGIPVRPGQTYTLSFFAQADPGFTGGLTASVQSTDGKTIYATGTSEALTGEWKQYTLTVKAPAGAPTTKDARFVLSTTGNGGKNVWLNNVSLFPPTYKDVKNGLRTDLMEKFADLKPSFIREPGGNYLEGGVLANRFDWQKTVGPVWTRPGHQNDGWGYWSNDGMGLLEYLTWAESIGAKPMLAVFAGYTLWGGHVPLDQLGPYVQDALDEIEYATGSVNTTWGARRAADGHPKAFDIDYIEIGNEDWFDTSGSYDGNNGRFAQFHDAIKAKYPHLKTIATMNVNARTPDVVDDHFYPGADSNSEGSLSHLYDTRDRALPKILVGEWAFIQPNVATPNLKTAVSDAAFLTGLIRNSDVVMGEAYAPSLVNLNNVAWKTNLIGFDALSSYGSPSYYVQTMLAAHSGDQVLDAGYAGDGSIYTAATRDGKTGKIYLTVVNLAGSAQPVTINLTGITDIRARGEATILTSANATDTNTITDPTAVVPTTEKVTDIAPTFDRTVPANSVTILTLG